MVPGQVCDSALGLLVHDHENQYHMQFHILLPYNEEQKEINARISKCKQNLKDTDYQPMKYVDGEYTEEEYEPKRLQRAAWRNEIRELEKKFNPPTITREEMDEAERKAMENIPKQYGTIL